MSDLRKVEKLDPEDLTWATLRMADLQIGDIFRLSESDTKCFGEFRADGEPYKNEEGVYTIVAMPFDIETWTEIPMKKINE